MISYATPICFCFAANMSKTVLCSIDANEHLYFLFTTTKDEGEDGIDLKVWDGHECWCGSSRC